ncbi:unnamed protein product, partial [Mesorhabditis belari]|uniref:Uncharacterized protein n=1 Tax=Mesorhabditis belari TaxID=2138241 RepID=A0AAF3JBK5_9BILA
MEITDSPEAAASEKEQQEVMTKFKEEVQLVNGKIHIAGAILAAGWYIMMTSMFTVTLYRFIVILFPTISQIVTTNRAFIVVLAGNLSIFVIVLFVHLIGWNAQYLTEFGWVYADGLPLTDLFNDFDNYGTPALTVICLFMYIAIFTFLMKNKKINRQNDIRWALQTFCFCLYTIFVSVEWTWIYDLVPETYTNLFLENFLWPLWNGANVVFFFTFQKNVIWGDKRVIAMIPVAGPIPPSRRNSCRPPDPKDTQGTRLSF